MVLTTKLVPSIVSAAASSVWAQPQLYDDFSSGTLNASRWTETTIPTSIHGPYPLFDEHYVNSSTERYQVRQNSVGERSVRLVPTRTFMAGETLDYDITHVAGEGNHVSHPYVNDQLPVLATLPNWLAGMGIGYWNDTPSTGGDLGTYHGHLEFNLNSIAFTYTRPNGTNYTGTILNSTSPHFISFGTYTGHNGTTQIDFDNFWINGVPSPSTAVLTGIGTAMLGRRSRRRKEE